MIAGFKASCKRCSSRQEPCERDVDEDEVVALRATSEEISQSEACQAFHVLCCCQEAFHIPSGLLTSTMLSTSINACCFVRVLGLQLTRHNILSSSRFLIDIVTGVSSPLHPYVARSVPSDVDLTTYLHPRTLLSLSSSPSSLSPPPPLFHLTEIPEEKLRPFVSDGPYLQENSL